MKANGEHAGWRSQSRVCNLLAGFRRRKAYVFQLRREARWSNGDPVTARISSLDFGARWIPTPGRARPTCCARLRMRPQFFSGELPVDQLGVRAIDDWTLEIRLSHPVPYFPDILTNTVASPVASVVARGIGRVFAARLDRLERAVRVGGVHARRQSRIEAQFALLGFGSGGLRRGPL